MAAKHCDLHETFRHNVIARRKELGLTQQAVADRIGVTQSTYAKIERGQFMPGLDQVERVAAALEIEASHLLEAKHLSRVAG